MLVNCTIAWLLYPALHCPQLNVQPPTRPGILSHWALKRNRCPDNIGGAGTADRFGKKAIPGEKGGVLPPCLTLITDRKRKPSIHSRVNDMKKRKGRGREREKEKEGKRERKKEKERERKRERKKEREKREREREKEREEREREKERERREKEKKRKKEREREEREKEKERNRERKKEREK